MVLRNPNPVPGRLRSPGAIRVGRSRSSKVPVGFDRILAPHTKPPKEAQPGAPRANDMLIEVAPKRNTN